MCPIRILFREETDTYSVVPIKQPPTDPLAWRALTPQMALLPSTGDSTMKRSTSEWSYTGRAVIVVSIQVTFSEVDTKQMDPSNARSDLWCLCSMGQLSHCGSNYALFLFGGCTPTIGSMPLGTRLTQHTSALMLPTSQNSCEAGSLADHGDLGLCHAQMLSKLRLRDSSWEALPDCWYPSTGIYRGLRVRELSSHLCLGLCFWLGADYGKEQVFQSLHTILNVLIRVTYNATLSLAKNRVPGCLIGYIFLKTDLCII